MQQLIRRWRPLPLGEALAQLHTGILPPRAVAVTFDDGYADLADSAFPILRESGVPATVFLVAALVGTNRPFWWEDAAQLLARVPEPRAAALLSACGLPVPPRSGDLVPTLKYAPADRREAFLDALRRITAPAAIQRMSLNWTEVHRAIDMGIDFGSHSLTHPVLTTLDDVTLATELRQSRAAIEAATGRPCTTLAYPNGDYDSRVRAAAAEAGYRWAFTMERGAIAPQDDPLALRRQAVYAYHRGPLFAALLSGWLNIPYRLARCGRQAF
jgi:peptidoglycan/xylan/chitin deacetylase (PgdA/CDA1 family)